MSLTDHQWSVLRLIRGGHPLCCEHGEYGPRYWINGARSISRTTAQALIDGGHVEPLGDGAFGTTQTWRAAGDQQPAVSGRPKSGSRKRTADG